MVIGLKRVDTKPPFDSNRPSPGRCVGRAFDGRREGADAREKSVRRPREECPTGGEAGPSELAMDTLVRAPERLRIRDSYSANTGEVRQLGAAPLVACRSLAAGRAAVRAQLELDRALLAAGGGAAGVDVDDGPVVRRLLGEVREDAVDERLDGQPE